MSNSSRTEEDKLFQRRALDAAVRISLLALLVLWCFNIIRPFIMPILWGAIMAVAIYPLYVKAHHKLGGREKLTAVLITLIALATIDCTVRDAFRIADRRYPKISGGIRCRYPDYSTTLG